MYKATAVIAVRLSEHGRAVMARGADSETPVVSAKAYLGALNKLTSRRARAGAERRIHSTDAG